ncbi:hypothetical protein G9A89_000467, partial [Geosiphon pyriformis]
MKLVILSAGGSGSGLTGLEIRKPEVTGGVVDLSAGPLPAALLHSGDEECKVSWGSKVENDESSVSVVLDVENMANTIAKETSYAESGDNDEMNETTPRKTQTCTYVLDKPPKAPTFDSISDDKNALSLPSPKMFNGSNQMPSVKSRVMKKRSFKPVKSFTLDIEVSAVPEKTNIDKLMAIKKIFYQIDGFGGASTPSKFSGVIRSIFIFELSLGRAKDMAISKKIIVNNDLRRVNSRSDWEVIIKEIPVNLSKSVVEAVFSKFGKIASIKMQLIGFWQKALVEFESSETVDDKQSWISRNRFWALLYTLSIDITAHDLSELVETY